MVLSFVGDEKKLYGGETGLGLECLDKGCQMATDLRQLR